MPSARIHFIDWLRVFAISLVVAHHVAQAYGPTGGEWLVKEPISSDLLSPFLAVNAGFGMALFFMLAGNFVPRSLEKKGSWRLMSGRLARLGIPLVIFGFVIFPSVIFVFDAAEKGFLAYYFDDYLGGGAITFGPLWFVFHLLVYSLGVVAIWPLFNLRTAQLAAPPGHAVLALLTLVTAGLTAITRSIWTQDVWIKLFGVFELEPAHLPQYLLMFLFGVVAGGHNWLTTLSPRIGFTWLAIGLSAAVFWYAQRYLDLFAGIAVIPAVNGPLYILWESVLCVGLCVGIVTFARKYWNVAKPALPDLARATYGVFLIHVFVVVPLQMAFLPVQLSPFLKFLVVTAIAIPLCFFLVIGTLRSADFLLTRAPADQ